MKSPNIQAVAYTGFLPWIRRISVIVAMAGACVPAMAATFSVNPVRIVLSGARPNAALQITNYGDEAVTIQAHIVTWAEMQANEEPSDAVLLNPPIFTIPARSSQFIRLGLRQANRSQEERAFRLVLDELPRPAPAGFSGLRTLVRMRIPIFSEPMVAPRLKLSWEASRMPSGGMRILVLNTGNTHIQMLALKVADNQEASFSSNAMTYLLPGESHEWLVDDARFAASEQVRVQARTDAGGVDETVALKRH
jgi:fimbrial chaperone protein